MGAVKIEDRLWLDLNHVNVPQVDRLQLEYGLRRTAFNILQLQAGSKDIVISVIDLSYVPTDYQPEGFHVFPLALDVLFSLRGLLLKCQNEIPALSRQLHKPRGLGNVIEDCLGKAAI